jgi:diadenosine tetraphosphate (Ap4A) HIT family hydrolase
MASKKQCVDAKNATVVKRNDYVNTLDTIVADGFCPFCEEHLFKHHRQPLIYKGRYWLVTENSWPYKGSRFHFLFIARQHIEKTEDASSAMWSELQRLYRKLTKCHQIKGATLMVRSGDTKITGATVNHLHAHLVVGTSRTKKTKPIKALVGFKR